jgi:hypothetical protein
MNRVSKVRMRGLRLPLRMRGAVVRVIAAIAVSGVVLTLASCSGPTGSDGADAQGADVAGANAATSALPLIPAPKAFAPGRGSFALKADTPVVAAVGDEGERVARYFVDLVSRDTGMKLSGGAGQKSKRAVVFELDDTAPAGEGYELDVSV